MERCDETFRVSPNTPSVFRAGLPIKTGSSSLREQPVFQICAIR